MNRSNIRIILIAILLGNTMLFTQTAIHAESVIQMRSVSEQNFPQSSRMDTSKFQSFEEALKSTAVHPESTSRADKRIGLDVVPSMITLSNSMITLSNPNISVKLNRALIQTPTGYLFNSVTSTNYSVELEPEGPTENWDFGASSGAQDGTASYAATTITVTELLNYDNSIAYRIVTDRSTASYQIKWNVTIILPLDRSYFIIHTEITNTGTTPAFLDEIATHIHDGIILLGGLRGALGPGTFPSSASDDTLFINGAGTVPFVGTTWWSAYAADAQKPYLTMSDGNTGDAYTAGYLQGSTAANQMVRFYRLSNTDPISAHIDITAAQATIPVGQTYSYDSFVGIHNTGVTSGLSMYDQVSAEYTTYMTPQNVQQTTTSSNTPTLTATEPTPLDIPWNAFLVSIFLIVIPVWKKQRR